MSVVMTDMTKNVDFILEGKKIITNPLKCRPKGISNARLKGHREKRKGKKLKCAEQNTPATEQCIAGVLES
ncbi:hypothetical protein IEQ34_007037 [Dendrobium chrysotoxum]|uniref:Uncharacterized protein n=1 Tax=Dendrobium chrysotoxum TaxID=161865 RepID=A0AAV7H591_DENCH|nr:hypothetical protein IEQ34_007037 [Dendrobium chrysotoxum]